MTISLAQAAIALGTFALLLVVVYGPWQTICTDITRQILFEKRDAIFDLARTGRLSFESSEYGAIRSSLQAQIRFAHELTLPRFIFMAAALHFAGGLPKKSGLALAIERIRDPETQAEVRRLITQADRTLFVMMYVKSPTMVLLCPILLLVLMGVFVARRFNVFVARQFKELERRAAGVVQSEAEIAEEPATHPAAA